MAETIWELNLEWQKIADEALDPEFDANDPSQMDHLIGRIMEVDQDIMVAADNWAALIQECLARAEMRKGEIERLGHRAQVDLAIAKRLKFGLKDLMNAQGKKRLETKRYKVTVAKNGGKPPLEIFDEAAAKRRYPKVQITVDTEKLREELEGGAQFDYACLGDRGTHLRIS